MSAAVLPSVPYSAKWIINKRDDLLWFVGSALAGYFALAAALISVELATPIFFIWFYFVNGPHLFATATRTYLDEEQRRTIPKWLWMIVPMTMIPGAAFALGGETILFVLGTMWGTFHISKQHMGIMMLYKRKNGERDQFDFKLDKWFLIGSQMLPFALFLLWYLSVPVRAAFFLYMAVILVVRELAPAEPEMLLHGPTFTHYLLDTRIWRSRNDPELVHAFNL